MGRQQGQLHVVEGEDGRLDLHGCCCGVCFCLVQEIGVQVEEPFGILALEVS